MAGQAADPYADEAKRTAALVAARVPEIPQLVVCLPEPGRKRRSVDRTHRRGDPRLHCRVGRKTLLLQPIGFLCDHVEILYDVDILFRGYAAKLGIRLERPESLNASPTLARAITDLALQGLARLTS